MPIYIMIMAFEYQLHGHIEQNTIHSISNLPQICIYYQKVFHYVSIQRSHKFWEISKRKKNSKGGEAETLSEHIQWINRLLSWFNF